MKACLCAISVGQWHTPFSCWFSLCVVRQACKCTTSSLCNLSGLMGDPPQPPSSFPYVLSGKPIGTSTVLQESPSLCRLSGMMGELPMEFSPPPPNLKKYFCVCGQVSLQAIGAPPVLPKRSSLCNLSGSMGDPQPSLP